MVEQPVIEQMAQREQAGPGALQYRDAARPQPRRDVRVDGRGQVAQHHHRLAGVPRGLGHRVRVGLVAVELVHQVHGQRHRGHGRVAGQRGQRPGQLLLGAGPRCPRCPAGWPAPGPGSSSPASRAVVGSPMAANGTPSSSATSATCARSSPESCTVAMPGAAPRGRGGRSRTAPACRPARPGRRPGARRRPRASASQPPSAAASAPEWADTMARPRAERPAVSSTTGMSPGARRRRARRVAGRRPGWPPAPAPAPGSPAWPSAYSRVLGRGGDQFLPGGHGHREAEPAAGAQHGGEHRARSG